MTESESVRQNESSERERPLFSVVVPVYNDEAGLALCLEALSRQTLGTTAFEVLVVDNGSTAPAEDVVSKFPFARLLIEPRAGSYNARNTGVRAARGEFLAFTDADCRPAPDWLERALEHFRANAEVAAIAGRIQLQANAHPTAAELYELTISFRQARFVAEGFAATANLLVRRDVFAAVGEFNGALLSAGDRDWGYRLQAAGYRMDYLPAAIVIHPTRATLKALIRKQRRLTSGFMQVAPPQMVRKVSDAPRGLGMAWSLLRDPGRHGLTLGGAVRVLGVAAVLILAGAVERVRLMLGAPPAR